ncbi:MAG: ADOP family duplicated permease [Vicinamibacterales bacterium]
MTPWRIALARLRELFGGARINRELDEEIAHHLDLLTDDYVRRGLSRDAARAAARRHFGGVDQAKESVRDRRGLPFVESLVRDVRHAGRLLAKSRAFTVTAVLTLALGIGVNTAIFSFVNAILLQPLPYADPDRLVSLWEGRVGGTPDEETSRGASIAHDATPARIAVAPANLADYRRGSTAFAGLAGVTTVGRNLTGAGMPERLLGEDVTANYFNVLGAAPAIGRTFDPSEDQPGASPVVILSAGLWQSRFGSDDRIIGRTITLDNASYQVIGVMPAGFTPAMQFNTVDPIVFWTPAAYPADLVANHGDHEINVVGRLAPGKSMAAAQAELTAISEELARQFPRSNATLRAFITPLRDDIVSKVRSSFVILIATVSAILLIACVNVANLLLVRAVARRREMAVRVALGAGRRRVMTELVTESLVLSGVACLVGLVLAEITRRLLVAAAPASIPRLAGVTLDWHVLAFAAGVSLVTGLGFGLLPAWQAGRARPVDALRTSERVVAGTWVMKWRNGLMVVEIALSTILLTGAGLMLKSLVILNGVALGFQPDHVLTANVNLPEARYPTADDRVRFFDALAARVSRLPGVESVAFANRFPLRGGWETGVTIDGLSLPGDGFVDVASQAVSPGYFQTLGIPLMRGRLLTPGDVKSGEPVAVVSDEFGRRILGGADPIGRRFRRAPTMPWIAIVGVVHDVRRDGQDTALMPQIYLPAAQTTLYPVRLADVAVRASGDPVALAGAIRGAVLDLDPNQPITAVRTLEAMLTNRAAERRFETLLFFLFAALAVALAVVGIFGVVAYVVSQRIPEIGVRMALGADGGRILRWLLGRTAIVVVSGAAVGVAASLGLSRFVATLLFQVQPRDGAVYTVAAGGLVLVALVTSALAARAATRINPTAALRAD